MELLTKYNKNSKSKNNNAILSIIAISIILFFLSACGNTDKNVEKVKDESDVIDDFVGPRMNLAQNIKFYYANATLYENSPIRLSDRPKKNEIDFDNNHLYIFTGKRINIAVTGLDGKIDYVSKIADANHIISILIETGEIEIISIPRDTRCDLGYEIVKGYDKNKLTYCRDIAGRERYHKELARIGKLDTIHYYVEFGFSQAMGIIEFLGYKEPANTLQVLRNRKAIGGDDYQRCYNQGQFIRQALLSHFNKFTGALGNVLIRSALLLVETNLTAYSAEDIVNRLEKVEYPQTSESVVVHILPPNKIAYKNYDFTTEETILDLITKIEDYNKNLFKKGKSKPYKVIDVQQRLNDVLLAAAGDTAKNPGRVISRLSPYFTQRAWYQVKDKNERSKIRDEFGVLLSVAYNKKDRKEDAEIVLKIVEADKVMFENIK